METFTWTRNSTVTLADEFYWLTRLMMLYPNVSSSLISLQFSGTCQNFRAKFMQEQSRMNHPDLFLELGRQSCSELRFPCSSPPKQVESDQEHQKVYKITSKNACMDKAVQNKLFMQEVRLRHPFSTKTSRRE